MAAASSVPCLLATRSAAGKRRAGSALLSARAPDASQPAELRSSSLPIEHLRRTGSFPGRELLEAQAMAKPADARTFAPVTALASSMRSKVTASATSSTVAIRP
jgi:hypothetical protein